MLGIPFGSSKDANPARCGASLWSTTMSSSTHDEMYAERDRDRALTIDFLRTLDPRRVETSLAELRHRIPPDRQRDLVYRVFHDSHKMYHAAALAEVAVEAMLTPFGYEPPSHGEDDLAHLVGALERWRVDPHFVRIVRELMTCTWSQERNAAESWHEDTRTLMSGFFVVHQAALASLEAMDRMCRREGFLWEDGPYGYTDALFLEVWLPVGLALRYWRDEPFREECRAILVAKTMGGPAEG